MESSAETQVFFSMRSHVRHCFLGEIYVRNFKQNIDFEMDSEDIQTNSLTTIRNKNEREKSKLDF